MNPDVGRRQYLATYSQVDESKFSTWENFGKMLEAEFNAGTSVVKWTIRLVSESSIRRWLSLSLPVALPVNAERLQKVILSQK